MKMDSILKNVTNGIWHAFNFLASNNDEIVYKSKLKVIKFYLKMIFSSRKIKLIN